MKRNNNLLSYFIFPLLLIVLAGCAAKTKMIAPPPQPSTLRYVLPEDEIFTYHMSTGFHQNLSMKGIPIKTSALSDISFSMTQVGYADNAYQLQLVINDVAINVTSPGSNINPDLDYLIGKTFEMTVTDQGEEIGIMGAEELTYSFGNSEEKSLSQEFKYFFPDLPDKSLQVGDTWTTVDTIDISEGDNVTLMVIKSHNTLTGYEQINEHECAKIAVDYTNKVTSSGTKNGAEFETFIDMNGKETMYFDYKQGVLVKLKSSGSGDGTVNLSMPSQMTLPISQTVTVDVELVE